MIKLQSFIVNLKRKYQSVKQLLLLQYVSDCSIPSYRRVKKFYLVQLMNSRETIDLFLSSKDLAIVGVSRNPKKFGHSVFFTLKKKGFNIFPVNPHTDVISDVTCFRTIKNLPPHLKNILIITNKNESEQAVSEAVKRGFENIWLQQYCETDEAMAIARANNINLISNACILMYLEPTGLHKLHRTITRIMGNYIK